MELQELLHKPNQLFKMKIEGNLTQNQIKLYDCILSNVKFEAKEGKQMYNIHYASIKELSGIEDKNDTRVRGYIKSLKDFDIEFEDENRGEWGCFSLLSEYRKNGEYIRVGIPEIILQALLKGDYYTTIDLLIQKSLKGKHTVFLYQHLKRNKFRGDIIIPLDELKEIFRVSEKKSYSDYNLFKKKVMNPSVKEIVENTDLKFTTEEIKTGRKVTRIKIIFDTVIEAKFIEEIQICTTTQEIIDKILKTDIIHMEGKRVKRDELEEAIKDLNKQHKKPDLIIEGLKKLVRDNKKTVNPISLKGYIWNMAKCTIESHDKPQEKKLIKIQEEKPKVITEEITEPINLNDYTEEQMEEAMKKCSENEDMPIKYLKDMLKNSEGVFKVTIKNYLPNLFKEDQVEIDSEEIEKIHIEQYKEGLKPLIRSKLHLNKITIEMYGKLIKKVTNIKNNKEFDSVMLEVAEID